MRVRMVVSMEGHAVSWAAGSEQTVDDAEAMRLIAAGFAVPVESHKLETAAAKPAREKRAQIS